jgi:hypothetical protein
MKATLQAIPSVNIETLEAYPQPMNLNRSRGGMSAWLGCNQDGPLAKKAVNC